VRYAQSKGLSLKVSDEFTVPLCAIHHHHLHTTGKEREWWQERNIDPLKIAAGLWHKSRERLPDSHEAELAADVDNDFDGYKEVTQTSDPNAKPGASATGASNAANSANLKS
jgi:hypothetical protein